MKTAQENDNVGPAGSLASQLHGAFDGFCAGIAEEEAIDVGWNDRAQLFDKLKEWLVVNDVNLTVNQQACLFTYRFDHARVAVPGTSNTDSAGEVQVGCAVLVVDITPSALSDNRCTSSNGERLGLSLMVTQ
jgi:hypothetical protein